MDELREINRQYRARLLEFIRQHAVGEVVLTPAKQTLWLNVAPTSDAEAEDYVIAGFRSGRVVLQPASEQNARDAWISVNPSDDEVFTLTDLMVIARAAREVSSGPRWSPAVSAVIAKAEPTPEDVQTLLASPDWADFARQNPLVAPLERFSRKLLLLYEYVAKVAVDESTEAASAALASESSMTAANPQPEPPPGVLGAVTIADGLTLSEPVTQVLDWRGLTNPQTHAGGFIASGHGQRQYVVSFRGSKVALRASFPGGYVLTREFDYESEAYRWSNAFEEQMRRHDAVVAEEKTRVAVQSAFRQAVYHADSLHVRQHLAGLTRQVPRKLDFRKQPGGFSELAQGEQGRNYIVSPLAGHKERRTVQVTLMPPVRGCPAITVSRHFSDEATAHAWCHAVELKALELSAATAGTTVPSPSHETPHETPRETSDETDATGTPQPAFATPTEAGEAGTQPSHETVETEPTSGAVQSAGTLADGQAEGLAGPAGTLASAAEVECSQMLDAERVELAVPLLSLVPPGDIHERLAAACTARRVTLDLLTVAYLVARHAYWCMRSPQLGRVRGACACPLAGVLKYLTAHGVVVAAH